MNLNIHVDQLKCLLIDFDGTLVNTIPILYDNYEKFLKKYGHQGSLEEFVSLIGPSVEEFVPHLKDKYLLTGSDEELISTYTTGLAARYRNEAILLHGAQEFLDYIRTTSLKMALVTSSFHSLIEGSLENLNLKDYFEFIITGEKVKKTKPDPEIYLLALKICDVQPSQALSIEDSYNGLLASLTAGIQTIALKNEHLKNIPAQAVPIENWPHLLQLFRNLYG